MVENSRLRPLGRFDGKGNFTPASTGRPGVPVRAASDREVPSCSFFGKTYSLQQVCDNVRFSRRSGEPRVYLAERLIAIIFPPAATVRLQEGQSVSVKLTRIRLGGDFPRIDCVLADSAGSQAPAAARPADNPVDPLRELTGSLALAETSVQLADLHGKLMKARQRGPRPAEVSALLETWQRKAAPLVEFYCRAVEVGWTRAAVEQYQSMRSLALKLGAEAARSFPDKYEGDAAKLGRVEQWTALEIAAWSLRHNPFHGQGDLDKLLAACEAAGEQPGLAEWLRHLTSDETGQAFFDQYPHWQAVPGVRPVLTAYFKDVLARIAPPKV